jgi:hypothetical protein
VVRNTSHPDHPDHARVVTPLQVHAKLSKHMSERSFKTGKRQIGGFRGLT